MSRSLRALLASAVLWAVTGTAVAQGKPAAADEPRFAIGRAPTAEEIAGWDIDVRADGHGVKKGKGTVAQGQEVFDEKCASCHGTFGESNRYMAVAGGVKPEDLKTGRAAALLAGLFHRFYRWVTRLLGGRQSLGAAVTLLVLLVLGLGPVSAFLGIVLQQALTIDPAPPGRSPLPRRPLPRGGPGAAAVAGAWPVGPAPAMLPRCTSCWGWPPFSSVSPAPGMRSTSRARRRARSPALHPHSPP